MFALPFASTLHHALTSHAFGRGDSRPDNPAPATLALAPAVPMVERVADEMPDLAQRVREVGEW